MFDNPFVFGLITSTLITFISYMIYKTKNKSEQEQKDKLNDMVILFIVCFVIIVVGKIMVSGSTTSTMSTAKVVESKGGQCPF
jgi:cytochrome bd-type quinol oxidase subunit 2